MPGYDFAEFIETVNEENKSFVTDINDYLLEKGFLCDIKLAKSGFTVSYVYRDSKRTLATYVSRKAGMKLRIYPENIMEYMDFLNTLPDKMIKDIKKSSVCKRLINPDDCNPRCVKGYDFFLEKEHYQKCRYSAFMLALGEKENPYIKAFLEKEIACSMK